MGEIHRGVDEFIASGFEKLFQRMQDEGRIAPDLEIPTLAQVFVVIGDGLFWRRAVDPAFDADDCDARRAQRPGRAAEAGDACRSNRAADK